MIKIFLNFFEGEKLKLEKKFLDYIKIENAPGGNQDWLPEWDMNKGGCAAVTACDLCIYLALKNNFKNLYPFDIKNLNRNDFIKFASIMKPYLTPRYHGIDFLEIYIDGLSSYWRDINFKEFKIEGISGIVNFEIIKNAIKNQINENIPVPFLLLNHEKPELEDLEWHWFNLAGYEIKNENFFVQVVTYGEAYMINLKDLWNSGHERRGGIIKIFRRV